MFWAAVKALFFRQLYGFKHQWFVSVSSVVFPIFLVWGMRSYVKKQGHAPSVMPLSLTLLFTPQDSEAGELINEASRLMRFHGAADFSLEPAESGEKLKQSLGASDRPAIGVQFHQINNHTLEYTLHPPPSGFAMDLPTLLSPLPKGRDRSPILQLQAAIDAAYIRKHLPGHGYLALHSRNTYADEGPNLYADSFIFLNVSVCITVGIILLMLGLLKYIVMEKQSGVRELLCVHGVPTWMTNTSWLFTHCLLAVFVAFCQLPFLVLPRTDPLLPHIDVSLLALLLIVHGCSGMIFSNVVANILTNLNLSSLLMILYWILTPIIGWIAVAKLAHLHGLQALLAFMPNIGLSMFLAILLFQFHLYGVELSFDMLSYSAEYISPGSILLLMILSNALFLALALYLDVVKPGPYGRARPWYLFKRADSTKVLPAYSPPDGDAFIQEIDQGVPIGLRCVNIVKKFGATTALSSVNLNIIKNSVTILLGHNGAGKTTLFSIMCGMFSPTSGDFYAEEFNVFKDIKRFRKGLGYCPQENLLFEELTVQEHLIIFGMLRGLTKTEALEYGEEWMDNFDIYSKYETQAKKLSGGTRRKLCLAIAMISGPRYLLLDEPSAGLDVESTRTFCDLILEEKGSRTVVITTHNMDEAEMLGDRIAILAQGQLKCYGESSFLKRQLDTGYRLTCTVTSSGTLDVIEAVKSYMKDAAVLYKMNRSVTFRLPSSSMRRVPDLLRRLENQFGDAVSSTLSPSTLDDVFIKVQKDLGVEVNLDDVPEFGKDEMRWSCLSFSELLRKRAKYLLTKRIVPVIALVIVLPSLALIGCMFLLNAIISPHDIYDSNIDDKDFSASKQEWSFSQHDIPEPLQSALKKSGISFMASSDELDFGKAPYYGRAKLTLARDDQPETPIAYFPSRDGAAISTAYSTLINALLQGNASIVTHLAPLWESKHFVDISCPIIPAMGKRYGELFTAIVLPFFSAASAYFVAYPHDERTALFKHLQLMTGLLPVVYWLANLIFDMMVYTVSFALFVAIMAVIDHFYSNVFLSAHVMTAFVAVLLLYGIDSITFSYIWSLLYRDSSRAVYAPFMLNVGMMNLRQSFPSMPDVYYPPSAILWSSLVNIVTWAMQKKSCDACEYGPSCQYVLQNPLFMGLKVGMICSLLFAVVHLVVLVGVDHGLWRMFVGSMQRCCFGRIAGVKAKDPVVESEKRRVKDMGKDEYPQFVCDGLGKKFSASLTAVYDVTFTAQGGECFGLVGVNGAGKSTTFAMLAAHLSAYKGTAWIDGRWKLAGLAYSYVKRVGYCPQSGGLLKELSGRNILRLFGRLGGVPKPKIRHLVDQWLAALGMTDIADRPCGGYSGGNKRKLSLAVALIGIQPVVLLDEPTAGVDPVARTRIWEILTACLEQQEQTVILTSHTMSECEAICNRLTIMVDGVMQCLGPIQQLKQRFGLSYILEVKLARFATAEDLTQVQTMIESRFAGFIEVQDVRLNGLVFLLKAENMKIYEVFKEMVKIKSKVNIIEDFNLSDTPLEQVFLKFARNT